MAPVLPTDWNDFSWFVQTYIPRQTIPTLKQFGDKIYDLAKIYIPIRSGERKQEITHKVQVGFQQLRAQNDLALYARVRQSCELIGVPIRPPTYYPPQQPTFGGVPAAAASSSSSSFQNRSGTPSNGYSYSTAGPSRPATTGWQATHNRPPPTLHDWKPNPMWKPVRALTEMSMLPDIAANDGSHVRRERKTPFSIPNDVLEKLNYTRANPHAHPRYAVRLFCTSSDYYRAPGQPIQPGQGLLTNRSLPIEYPTNPDITVDNYNLPFKEKGLRGKAGSAPPFDLEKGPVGLSRVPGRMLSVTLGHTGPSIGKKKDISKKFSYQIVFAEITAKEELLKRLNSLEPTNADDALKEFQRKQEEDDDIVVGTSMMSLKDPLSYMRISRPVRSSKCTHLQCFDAQWWIESNAQHPQWLCPHCNKELQFPDLIVDGYVLSILKAVPESFDDVVLEPNGEWHTENNKYGSANWMAEHGQAAQTDTKPEIPTSPGDASLSPSDATNNKRKFVELLLSDSEDEDEDSVPLAKINGAVLPRPSIPTTRPSYTATPNLSLPSSSRPSSTQPANQVIDLTLSDSDDDDTNDEEPLQPPFRQPGAGALPPSAVESPRPPLTHPKEDPVARPATTSTYPGAGIQSGGGGGGGAARSTGAGIRPYPDFYDSDPWRNGESRMARYETQRWVPPNGTNAPNARIPPPPLPGSVGPLGKRPRADDWMDDGPRHSADASNTHDDRSAHRTDADTREGGARGSWPLSLRNSAPSPGAPAYSHAQQPTSSSHQPLHPPAMYDFNEARTHPSAQNHSLPPPSIQSPQTSFSPTMASSPALSHLLSPALPTANGSMRPHPADPSSARTPANINGNPPSRQSGSVAVTHDHASARPAAIDRVGAPLPTPTPARLPIHTLYTQQDNRPEILAPSTASAAPEPRLNNTSLNSRYDAGPEILEDDDAPVRSSSLGLGEEEEMFWDGVLNGRLNLEFEDEVSVSVQDQDQVRDGQHGQASAAAAAAARSAVAAAGPGAGPATGLASAQVDEQDGEADMEIDESI